MFNAEKLQEPDTNAASAGPPKSEDPLAGLDQNGLLALRAKIDLQLPPVSLTDIDLEEETLRQYQQTRALFSTIIGSTDTPANQKAQLANSCTTILQQLTLLQSKLYSSERLKAIEQTLIKVVKTLPREAQEQFFVDYERIHAEEGK